VNTIEKAFEAYETENLNQLFGRKVDTPNVVVTLTNRQYSTISFAFDELIPRLVTLTEDAEALLKCQTEEDTQRCLRCLAVSLDNCRRAAEKEPSIEYRPVSL